MKSMQQNIPGRMYRIFLLFLIVIPQLLCAQNSKRGFKFLERSDYDKAADEFKDVLAANNQDATAMFGLAMVYGDEHSTQYNLIDAWDYAQQCKKNEDKLSPDDLELLGDYFHETETRPRSIPVKKKVDYAVDILEAKLIKFVREENNLDVVYQVLEKFPDFKYHDNVVHIRNQLEFRKYEKQNTLAGYEEFIKRFPDAAQIDKAVAYRNQLSFDKARQANTVEAYQEYLKQFPKATEHSEAIKMLYAAAFRQAKQINTIEGFDDFIHKYPDALETADARQLQKQLLYEYAKKIHTLEAYNEFIRKYPEGQQYVDIFNLRSLDKGLKTLTTFPVLSNNIDWARSFGSEDYRELSACLAIDSMNRYVVGGTVVRNDTTPSDAWVIKVGDDGKMIWNKMVGEAFTDELNRLEITRGNAILGFGYTWLGTDSSSRQPWIFKLGSDGQKLWSKTLKDIHVNTELISNQGDILLGGYERSDTSGDKYALIALNDRGKYLWNRTYTNTGQVAALCFTPDNRLILAGNFWHAKLDLHGYLIWDSPEIKTDSTLAAVVTPKGEIVYLASRNKSKSMLIKTNTDNKTLFERELNLPDTLQEVVSLLNTSPGVITGLLNFRNYQTLTWFNTAQGDIKESIRMPEGLQITRIKTDFQGNLMLVGKSGEILLIKNKGTTF